MPYKPDVSCKHPGCPNLVSEGTKYCDEKKALHLEEVRSADSSGYDSRCRKESKMFLDRHPLCVNYWEEGKFMKATVVDHIIPTVENRSSFGNGTYDYRDRLSY